MVTEFHAAHVERGPTELLGPGGIGSETERGLTIHEPADQPDARGSVAGLTGAGVAAGATFLPSFLFTVIPAPYFHRYGKRPWLAAIVAGITAGATEAIAGAVIVLARQSLVDLTTVLIAVRAFKLTCLKWKIPEPCIVVAAAIIGLAVRG